MNAFIEMIQKALWIWAFEVDENGKPYCDRDWFVFDNGGK